METATARPSVFISYNQADRAWAEWIAWTLEENGYTAVIQAWDIRPGANFVLEMHRASAETDKTVIVLTDHYLRSDFTRPEWAASFARDPLGRERKLIPVRVAPCSPGGLLAQIVWTDLVGLDETAARERLLQAFAERGKPLQAPAFPGGPASPELGRRSVGPFPGDPPVHNLPYPRLGDLFTGRQAELDALAGGGTAAITQGAAISGLGGIGKTRLAVEYAWRSGNRYTAAWFVRADSPENLRRNLAALARPELLNLPEWEEQNEARTVAAVQRALREHPGWLMILDNVDTPEAADAVLEILPSFDKGRVLITSRLASWPPEVQKQPLEKLSQEEAVRFLLHRTEGGRETAADEDATAGDLAQRVDGLPLALEQVAAFIVRHRMRLADYLRAWEEEREQVLRWFEPRGMHYPASVAVTWQHTFQQLAPTPAALLRLTAFLAPDPIPVEIFEQGVEHVEAAAGLYCEESGKAPDEKAIREAVADLAGFSMVSQGDGRTFAVHRMLREALRQQIPERLRKGWVERAVRVVDEAFVGNPQDVRTWPLLDRLRPHAAQVVAWADQEGLTDPTSWLMNQLGLLFFYKGLYAQAEPLMRRALAIDEAAFGNDHPNVARDLNNLATLLQATNRLAEAEPLMRRALAIDEASFGNDHPNVAIRLNNLATLLQATNRLAEAEPLKRRALAIDEAAFGNDHPNVAIQLNNLAQLLKATNRLAEAEPLMRRALGIDETSFGNNHPNVARDLNNLAQLLQATNRLAEAEPLMRRALAIDEASFGKDHPKVAIRLNNLAGLFQATNRLAEAEPLMRRALAIDEASFGNDHPNVARDLNNLAQLLRATNRLAEAEPLMRRALNIDEASFGKDHPNVAIRLNNLATLLQATNRLAEAEPLMRRALAIDETSFGNDHPEVASDLNNLALLLQATNRLAEAEPLMWRALAIGEASLGDKHPDVAIVLNNLAQLLQATNRLAEAVPLANRSRAIFLEFERQTGEEHPNWQLVERGAGWLRRLPADQNTQDASSYRPLEPIELLLLVFRLVATRRASPDLLLHLDAARLREAAEGALADSGRETTAAGRLRTASTLLAEQMPDLLPDPLWQSWMLASQSKALHDLAAASASELPS